MSGMNARPTFYDAASRLGQAQPTETACVARNPTNHVRRDSAVGLRSHLANPTYADYDCDGAAVRAILRWSARSAAAVKSTSEEELSAVSALSWMMPMRTPMAMTCAEVSPSMPSSEQAIGMSISEPPGTPALDPCGSLSAAGAQAPGPQVRSRGHDGPTRAARASRPLTTGPGASLGDSHCRLVDTGGRRPGSLCP